MRKTLSELHQEIQPIVDLTKKELQALSKDELLNYQKKLIRNSKRVNVEKIRYINNNNVQANATQRVLELEEKSELIDEILFEKATLKNKEKSEAIKHPFINDETLKLFNSILEKWNYNKDLKYAYIFNELFPENHHCGEYEFFVRKYYKSIIKFNYNNAISDKIIEELKKIIKEELKNN